MDVSFPSSHVPCSCCDVRFILPAFIHASPSPLIICPRYSFVFAPTHHRREYFNNIFPKVTKADIDAFEVKYKCSDEEEADVLKYYSQFKGDLNKMMECVMLSSDVDKERWVKDYIEPAVERGDVDDYMAKIQKSIGHAPTKTKKKKKNKTRTTNNNGRSGKKKTEEKMIDEGASDSESNAPMAQVVVEETDDNDHDDNEVEVGVRTKGNKTKSINTSKTNSSSSAKASAKKMSSTTSKNAKSSDKLSEEEDLIAQIRGNALARRQAGFESLMAGLEDRYGGDKKKGGKKRQQQQSKKDEGDIDDDEFARIQAKLMKKKESKQRQK